MLRGVAGRLREATVGSRGVLFAIDQDEVRAFRHAASDRDVRALVATIEHRWDKRFLAQTDSAWDAIHRCLTDGSLAWGNGSFPLNRCILGGEDLYQGEDYIVTLTEAHEVPAVATALQQVTEAFMRQAYDRLDSADYGPNWSEEDFESTWSWFQEVRDLWSRAATAGRAVIFTVSQ
jgi:Domain of unknown function (DUF1877)